MLPYLHCPGDGENSRFVTQVRCSCSSGACLGLQEHDAKVEHNLGPAVPRKAAACSQLQCLSRLSACMWDHFADSPLLAGMTDAQVQVGLVVIVALAGHQSNSMLC